MKLKKEPVLQTPSLFNANLKLYFIIFVRNKGR